MKKTFLIISIFLISSSCAFADAMTPIPDFVNSHIFSTDATKPMVNLERSHYTNKAIMQIEEKQRPQKETSAEIKTDEPVVKEKSKFKDLFKGFVIEY